MALERLKKLLGNNQYTTFQHQWQVIEPLLNKTEIVAEYIRVEGAYLNVALVTNYLIIDVEGDDTDGSGHATCVSLKDLGKIAFYSRSGASHIARGLPKSQNALLIVVLGTPANEIANYWIAKTEPEETELTNFGTTLMLTRN